MENEMKNFELAFNSFDLTWKGNAQWDGIREAAKHLIPKMLSQEALDIGASLTHCTSFLDINKNFGLDKSYAKAA